MPDRQGNIQAVDRAAGWQARAATASGGADSAADLARLRVEDIGMGMAKVAVNQLVPHAVAQRVAAILVESGVASAEPGGPPAVVHAPVYGHRLMQRRRRGTVGS